MTNLIIGRLEHLKKKIGKFETKELIKTFEEFEKNVDNGEISQKVASELRAILMDELLKRDEATFEKWIDEEFLTGEYISPRKFYL